MQIEDAALIVSVQHYAERDFIVHAFTQHYGMVHGLIKGSRSKKTANAMDIGVLGDMHWQARLPEHLGTMRFESRHHYGALLLHDRVRLCMLSSACALIRSSFALHDPHITVFDHVCALFGQLCSTNDKTTQARAYIAFECMLLEEAGYGLDFSQCAATGSTKNLHYVSPKSGRAVSAEAAEPYRHRLLPLPAFLCEGQGHHAPQIDEIANGLHLTGHFIAGSLREIAGKDLPPARLQLSAMFA